MSKSVALVLSSGGARGFAHIGVIETLLAHDYKITSISGCSMGSVIGAFYACGRLDDFKAWALELDRMNLFNLIDFTFSVSGFVKGEKVFKTLESIIPDSKIEDMDIPFVALATDLQSRQGYVFDKGSMYAAIKASVAIPTVIKPVKINGTSYIDGGVTNPIPIDCVPRQDGDILVVSNVNAIKEYTKPKKVKSEKEPQEQSYNQKIQQFLSKWNKFLPGTSDEDTPNKKLSFFDLLNDSIDLMQDKLTELILEKHQPDILVNVSRDASGTFEFYRAKELIAAGAEAMEKALRKAEKESKS